MLLVMFKWAIIQRGLSVSKFVNYVNVNLLAVYFLGLNVPLLSLPAKKNFRDVVAVVNLESSGVVVSYGCVSCLSLKPDD